MGATFQPTAHQINQHRCRPKGVRHGSDGELCAWRKLLLLDLLDLLHESPHVIAAVVVHAEIPVLRRGLLLRRVEALPVAPHCSQEDVASLLVRQEGRGAEVVAAHPPKAGVHNAVLEVHHVGAVGARDALQHQVVAVLGAALVPLVRKPVARHHRGSSSPVQHLNIEDVPGHQQRQPMQHVAAKRQHPPTQQEVSQAHPKMLDERHNGHVQVLEKPAGDLIVEVQVFHPHVQGRHGGGADQCAQSDEALPDPCQKGASRGGRPHGLQENPDVILLLRRAFSLTGAVLSEFEGLRVGVVMTGTVDDVQNKRHKEVNYLCSDQPQLPNQGSSPRSDAVCHCCPQIIHDDHSNEQMKGQWEYPIARNEPAIQSRHSFRRKNHRKKPWRWQFRKN
eukprot:RCo028981